MLAVIQVVAPTGSSRVTTTNHPPREKNLAPCVACRKLHKKCAGGYPCEGCRPKEHKALVCFPSKVYSQGNVDGNAVLPVDRFIVENPGQASIARVERSNENDTTQQANPGLQAPVPMPNNATPAYANASAAVEVGTPAYGGNFPGPVYFNNFIPENDFGVPPTITAQGEEHWAEQNMHGGMYTAHPDPESYMGFQLAEAIAPADFNPQGYQFQMHPAMYNEGATWPLNHAFDDAL